MTKPIAGLNCEGNVLFAAASRRLELLLDVLLDLLLELLASSSVPLPWRRPAPAPPAGAACFSAVSLRINSSCCLHSLLDAPELLLDGLELLAQLIVLGALLRAHAQGREHDQRARQHGGAREYYRIASHRIPPSGPRLAPRSGRRWDGALSAAG